MTMSPNLSRLDVLGGLLIGGSGSALRADLNNFSALLYRRQKHAGIGHGMCGGLLHVGIAAGIHRFSTVVRVLKIGSCDNDCIDVLAGIELVVVSHLVNRIGGAAHLLDEGRTFFATFVPDVGNGHDLEVHLFVMGKKRRQVALSHAVAAADDTYADAIVCAQDSGVALRARRKCSRGECCSADLQKISATALIRFHDGHL